MSVQFLTVMAPGAMIGLSVVAGVMYWIAGEWWKGVYWFAAAGLNVAVTFGMK